LNPRLYRGWSSGAGDRYTLLHFWRTLRHGQCQKAKLEILGGFEGARSPDSTQEKEDKMKGLRLHERVLVGFVALLLIFIFVLVVLRFRLGLGPMLGVFWRLIH